MIYNEKKLTVYGMVDTPWSADFAEISAKVDAQAAAVEQNAADIEELKNAATGSPMTAVLENGTATAYIFNPADFDILLIGATPGSGHLTACATIPAAMAAVGLEFQIADEASFTKWSLSATGITRTSGEGTLTYIYGVKL